MEHAVAFLVRAEAPQKTVRVNITARESQIEVIDRLARKAGMTSLFIWCSLRFGLCLKRDGEQRVAGKSAVVLRTMPTSQNQDMGHPAGMLTAMNAALLLSFVSAVISLTAVVATFYGVWYATRPMLTFKMTDLASTNVVKTARC